MSEPTAPAVVEIERERDANEAPQVQAETNTTALVEDELLVEDVSIDGMCGVY